MDLMFDDWEWQKKTVIKTAATVVALILLSMICSLIGYIVFLFALLEAISREFEPQNNN